MPFARPESLAPSAASATVVRALCVEDHPHDRARVVVPSAEAALVVRMGSMASEGLDVHAVGGWHRVRRKFVRGGQRTVIAWLRLGASEAVFGVPAATIADRHVPIEELWGGAVGRRLRARLAEARDARAVASILDAVVSARVANAARSSTSMVALRAAERLATSSVERVAEELGVSERTLRRSFHDAVGMSPKAYAQLARFHRALRAGRADERASWASIAVEAGYYDQAHLIASFRSIASVTPRALLDELRGDAGETESA